jgi:O-antigen ligase
MGLLLGQLVGIDKDKIIARAFMLTISIVVPWQLLASWLQNDPLSNDKLTHYLFAFSIYAHRQYVTLIFVCAFAYATVSLWQEYKRWFCVLTALMFVYVSISLSYLTIFSYFAFLLIFWAGRLWPYLPNMKVVLVSLLAFSLVTWAGYAYIEKVTLHRTAIATAQDLFHGKFDELLNGQVPTNVQSRVDMWKLFAQEILTSHRTLLVGHPQPMPRAMKANPHNGYLDVAYSFGLIGLLPICALIIYTSFLCWVQRKTLSKPAWWLLTIVVYIVVVDNNFKSTLRQPYPGIFEYFLWGMLLHHLRFGQPTATPSKATTN